MEIFTQVPSLSTLLSPQPDLRGVLFDMDGTIFNTEPIHAEVFVELAQELKVNLPSQAELDHRFKGMTDRQVLEHARSWLGFPDDLSFDEFIQLKNTKLLKVIASSDPSAWTSKSVFGLLNEIKDRKFLLGVITSSERVITEALLKKAGIREHFDLIITLQDVTDPKPHPGPYIKGMQLLGLGRLECLIFEDSATGLKAGVDSGARTVQVKWW